MAEATHILILNYNSGASLADCLASLERSDARDLPVLIVDNASTDGSLDDLTIRDNLDVLRLSHNGGFAAGINAGVRVLLKRSVERVLLLNPDTCVGEGFLEPLQRALDEGAAIAGPKLLLPGQPARVWCAGGDVTFGLNMTRLRGHRSIDRGQFNDPCDVTFLPATVWLLSRSVWTVLGELDERFFCYLEDVDYCIRATGAGNRIRYEPRSVVVHVGSFASGGGYTPLRKYLNALGSCALLRKHGNLRRWLSFVLFDVVTTPAAMLYGLFRRRPAAAWWKIRGLWDGFRGRSMTEQRLQELLPGARS